MKKNPWEKIVNTLTTLLGLDIVGHVTADCECGYSITTGDDLSTEVFTDILESDFVHIDYRRSDNKKKIWATQVYKSNATAARSVYGEWFTTSNVEGNTIADMHTWTEDGPDRRDAGLELRVGSVVADGMVQNGQVATTDEEYFHGSYRASIKVSAVEGTCMAFFWYFNDTQEIDLEFLSREFVAHDSTYPVNFVLQTRQSKAAGYDATKTGSWTRSNLSFDPTADFHEYRFDFLSSRVLFYADNSLLASMNASTGGVPSTSGNLVLSHWSNGNAGWSGGPPTKDATSVVCYVKAYYNSSSEVRRGDFEARCQDPTRQGAVCEVPEGNATFFFMYKNNMTVNETTYGGSGSGGGDGSENEGGVGRFEMRSRPGSILGFYISLATILWLCGL
ncbi:putative GH16 domain-containing protein [Seiridium unicorne]|uniref:GH16 domain-containing protein n=1 Tax=Seiridium unicorne TaxID=138068 RepID=A0ABR2V2R5_9PEZI